VYIISSFLQIIISNQAPASWKTLFSSSSKVYSGCSMKLYLLDSYVHWNCLPVDDAEVLRGTSSSWVDWADIFPVDPLAWTFCLINLRVTLSEDLFLFWLIDPELAPCCFCVAGNLGCLFWEDETQSTYINRKKFFQSEILNRKYRRNKSDIAVF
jgi:hypothetical protein